MVIKASEKNILPGLEVGRALAELMKELKTTEGEKELVFEKGEYLISAASCDREKLFITNTVGDEEYKKEDEPHVVPVAFNLEGIKNLKISGNGAVFTISGKATTVAVRSCENIEFNDLAFRVDRPDYHEIKVINKSPFSVDFELTGDSQYEKNRDGKGFSFVGDGYKTDFFIHRMKWGYFHRIFAENKNHMVRVKTPFYGAHSIKELKKNHFRAYYTSTSRFKIGDIYGLYDLIRQYNGIFTDRVKNFTLKNVKQHFAYGLALVCQNTENITIDGVTFAPEEGSVLHTAACADFMHLCMCKGDIKITNSLFEGAGDDCLNVHGIHFKITKMDGNKLTVRFMHPQAHGFNPLNAGDKIEYVDPAKLLPTGAAQIKSSKLLNEYEIELEVDNTQGAEEGLVIEDVTLCPNVYFAKNTINRIVTRGLLLTTRGKILVENNHFKDNEMDGILFSDDAKSWYESGRVFDATIRGNRFDYCGSYYVEVLPENGKTGTIVHEKFLIENNDFNSPLAGGINAKGTRHLIIRNNRFKNPKTRFLKTNNVEKVESDL